MKPIRGNKVFILINDTWFLQYEWIAKNGLYSYGLRLRYKQFGTDFKYIHSKSKQFSDEKEMKRAIKTEVSNWLIEKQKEHNISELPIGQVQEIVNPQLKLFK